MSNIDSNRILRSQTKDLSEENKDVVLGFSENHLPRTPIKILEHVPIEGQSDSNLGTPGLNRPTNSTIPTAGGNSSANDNLPTATDGSTVQPTTPTPAVKSTNQHTLPAASDGPTNQNNSPTLTDRSTTSSDEDPPGSESDENENLETAHDGLSAPSSDDEVDEEEMANNFIKPRDIVSSVPVFTGDKTGCTYREFAAACEDAKICLPANLEPNFTQLLKTRLSKVALQLSQGHQFNTLKDLLKHLKGIFNPRESINSLRGELGRIHQVHSEDVPSYLNNVR